jgi:hypothetical protein
MGYEVHITRKVRGWDDATDGVFGVGNGLALSRVAYFALAFAIVEECDNRRRGAAAFGVRDYNRLVAFHYGDARVGGAQVNTDDFAHDKVGAEV